MAVVGAGIDCLLLLAELFLALFEFELALTLAALPADDWVGLVVAGVAGRDFDNTGGGGAARASLDSVFGALRDRLVVVRVFEEGGSVCWGLSSVRAPGVSFSRAIARCC